MTLPPQSIETEESILSACLLDHAAIIVALDTLRPADFYNPKHGKIFSAIRRLEKSGDPVDLITVTESLKAAGDLRAIGGPVELARLIDCCPVPGNTKTYCNAVKDKATLRALVAKAQQIIQECHAPGVCATDAVDAAQAAILSVRREDAGEIYSVADMVPDQLDRYERLYQAKTDITGLRTLFTDLDRITSGLQPTDLIILAGRPSMGKSALAANIAKNLGGQKIPGAVFSLEMSRSQLLDRFFADLGKINLISFRNGRFKPQEWNNVAGAAEKISEMPIFIDDTAETHFRQIRRKARRLYREKGVRWFVIDYLQLMYGDAQSREREVSEITRNLKLMAKELEVPVICLAQLNRGCEMREQKRPKLSDLRESGAIEQDSDMVWFMYRDEVYNPGQENDGQAELIVAKQRNGPIGIVPMTWDKRTASFRDRRL